MLKLDYSQYKCPYPVIETRKQMLANPESALNVLVGDQAGRDNVARLADKMGYQSSVTTEGKLFCLTLTPAESPRQRLKSLQNFKTGLPCGRKNNRLLWQRPYGTGG